MGREKYQVKVRYTEVHEATVEVQTDKFDKALQEARQRVTEQPPEESERIDWEVDSVDVLENEAISEDYGFQAE